MLHFKALPGVSLGRCELKKKAAISGHYGEVCELKGYPGSSKDTPRIDFFRSILIRNQLE